MRDQPTVAEQLKRNGHTATSEPDEPNRHTQPQSKQKPGNADYWAEKRRKKGKKAA